VAVAGVWLCQALALTCNLIATTVCGVIGTALAPTPALGTLPFSLLLAGTTFGMLPAGRLMMRSGRRTASILGSAVGAAGGALSAFAIWQHSFAMFSIGALVIGGAGAFAGFYRFAAVHLIDPGRHAHLHSAFVAGGLVASLAGPAIAQRCVSLVSAAPHSGTYLVLSAIFLGTAVMLALMKRAEWSATGTGRPLGIAHRDTQTRMRAAGVATAANAVAVAAMTALMVAMPIVGHAHGVPSAATSLIMQVHFVGMYAPGLVAGPLVARLGTRAALVLGAALALLGAASTWVTGTDPASLTFALLVSGASWAIISVAAATEISHVSQPAMEARLGFYVSLGSALVSFAVSGALAAIGWPGVNAFVVLMFVSLLALFAWSRIRERLSLEAARSHT
jgi:MFS family permease